MDTIIAITCKPSDTVGISETTLSHIVPILLEGLYTDTDTNDDIYTEGITAYTAIGGKVDDRGNLDNPKMSIIFNAIANVSDNIEVALRNELLNPTIRNMLKYNKPVDCSLMGNGDIVIKLVPRT